MLDSKLLEILACPLCKGELEYDRSGQRLICRFDKKHPIRNNIPVMLVDEATKLID